ncbi:hypothetical protein NHX12_018051, partial [Muraenolepis orangiensis]
ADIRSREYLRIRFPPPDTTATDERDERTTPKAKAAIRASSPRKRQRKPGMIARAFSRSLGLCYQR